MLSLGQGWTYANRFAAGERFIGAKIKEGEPRATLGDQSALEALVRTSPRKELKHQELFRRIERMIAAGLPEGYRFAPRANDVASAVLGKSTWSVLCPHCMIEIFTLAQYRESIARTPNCPSSTRTLFLFP